MGIQSLRSFTYKHNTKFSEQELQSFLPISFFLRRIRLENLFHFYTLILVLCLFIFFTNLPIYLGWVDAILIFISLWIQLIQAFIIRFNLGLADKYLRAYTLNYNWEKLEKTLPTVTKKDVTIQTITFVIGLTLTAILGYSAVYFEISRLLFGTFQSDKISLIDSLYFSTVTFTTVGFGDISPKSDFSKIVVASEIMYGFSIFAILVLSFSLTLTDDWET